MSATKCAPHLHSGRYKKQRSELLQDTALTDKAAIHTIMLHCVDSSRNCQRSVLQEPTPLLVVRSRVQMWSTIGCNGSSRSDDRQDELNKSDETSRSLHGYCHNDMCTLLCSVCTIHSPAPMPSLPSPPTPHHPHLGFMVLRAF